MTTSTTSFISTHRSTLRRTAYALLAIVAVLVPSCAEVELTGDENTTSDDGGAESASEAAATGADGSSTKTEPVTPQPTGTTTTTADPTATGTGTTPPPPPAPGCTDGAKNGTETDVDCGGSCGKCASGKACAAATDCTSGGCVANRCVYVVSVGVGGMSFSPAAQTINAGDTVRFKWVTDGHTVTGGTGCGQATGGWCAPSNTSCGSAPTEKTGFTYDHTFTTAGAYPYYCAPHCSMMKATITVQ